MKKSVALFSIFFAFFCFILPTKVQAAIAPYSVGIVRPQNQLGEQANYFDLLVKPNASQTLSIRIQNPTTASHRYKVAVNRALTNQNGVITYADHDQKAPKSLAINIEQLMSAPKTVTVPAQSTKTVHLTLNAPKDAFNGVLLGGLYVTQVDGQSASTDQIANAIAVQLRTQKDIKVAPKFALDTAEAARTNSGQVVSFGLENQQPTIITNAAVSAKLTNSKGKQVMRIQKDRLNLAPNSVMTMPLNTTPRHLKSGRYRLSLTVTLNQQTWHFTKKVTVTNPVEQKAAPVKHNVTNLPTWVVVLLIVLAAVLLLAVFWLLSGH